MSIQKRTREQIVQLIAQDIPDGSYVNLGIGLPTKFLNTCQQTGKLFFIQKTVYWLLVHHQSGQEDPDLINAGKEFVTLLDGGCFMHHGDSFDIMRGGHLDICVLGAFQVAVNGDWPTGILVKQMQYQL